MGIKAGTHTSSLKPASENLKNTVRVSVLQKAGAMPFRLLEEVLVASNFWKDLNRVRRSWKSRRRPFTVLIKPDLDHFESATHCGTEPALVEHLIDLLHDQGYLHVTVGEARNSEDSWLLNRDPMVVPDLVGYNFKTPKGRIYEVVNIGAESDPNTSPPTLSKHWVQTSYRINFAKNKTHEDCTFALCLHNLAGLAAAQGRGGRKRVVEEDCLYVLRKAPPHFNLIDAYTSAHGGAGQRAPRALATHTFFASTNTLLIDWAGAARMGVDPYASHISAVALGEIGLPLHHEIDGDLSPFPLWKNVHPLMAHSALMRNRSAMVGSMSVAWYQSVDRERFPFCDFYNDRINAILAPLMSDVDNNVRSFWIVVMINFVLSRIDRMAQSQNTLFSKDKLLWRTAPLVMNPDIFEGEAYEGITAQLAPYKQLVKHLSPGREGARLRHINKAIIFECTHEFPIAFNDFTKRVEIARAIQYMNDYLGGSTIAVKRDARGRVVHQAERNIYLQQPNWMVLFGGEVIDVEKIQFISYGRNQQTISWRTVGSPNGSATVDDGSFTFSRTENGQTKVQIFVRQKFSLPLAFQVFDINLTPVLRDPIIESTYRQFFTGTMSNLQAVYDGRDYRIGHDAELGTETAKQSLPRLLATAAAAVAELLRHRNQPEIGGSLGAWLFGTGNSLMSSATIEPDTKLTDSRVTDTHGFQHFSGDANSSATSNDRDDQLISGMAAMVRDAPDFMLGLADALHRDLDDIANSGNSE
jgi:uncharacterized protein (DUF362 family)